MEFYSSFGKRPIRLCDATRAFAWKSLNCRYGRETASVPAVALDDTKGFWELTPLERYDLAIRKICEKAPLRICHGELLSGAATLGDAISHRVPVTYGGDPVLWSVSHLTTDFETVLKRGVNGIREDVLASLEVHGGTEREPFLKSCLSCLESFALWHGRYLDALGEREGFEENLRTLLKVPFGVPETFREALQSLWFTFAF